MRIGVTLALLSTLLPTGAVAATRSAHVSVTSTSPVTVRGSGFVPRERVTVTVAARATRTKGVTASIRGRFSLRFSGLSIGYCEPYTVRAKGNRGSTAFLKVIPECASP